MLKRKHRKPRDTSWELFANGTLTGEVSYDPSPAEKKIRARIKAGLCKGCGHKLCSCKRKTKARRKRKPRPRTVAPAIAWHKVGTLLRDPKTTRVWKVTRIERDRRWRSYELRKVSGPGDIVGLVISPSHVEAWPVVDPTGDPNVE
jgi:hypothetical protein